MPHETPLIATIVAGLGLAFVFGTIAHRLKAPPLVGYLLAGVAVGPFTPGFVADSKLAAELAEIGVILLMFGVGLHFSLKDLLSVRAIALPGAVVQIGVATLFGLGLAWTMGWNLGGGLVFGLALSVASTVVLLRAIQERRLMETERGRIAVGWLIVEDLAMVLALVLLPALAPVMGGTAGSPASYPIANYLGWGVPGILFLTVLKVSVFFVIMLVVGGRFIPWVLHYIAHTGSRELFRLAVLAIALTAAFASAKLFGVSLALGAFFAGMILSESTLSQRAAQESLPLRDAFAVLFFVSVGMLFNPASVLEDPLPMLATLLIIVVVKSVAAYWIVVAFGHSRTTALTIAASLAQIGEFSFILAELGIKLQLLPEQGRDLILGGAILSILINPVIFAFLDRWVARQPSAAKPEPARTPAIIPNVEPVVPDPKLPTPQAPLTSTDDPPPNVSTLTGHTILVGYGRVGSIVAEKLRATNQPFAIIEASDPIVDQLRKTSGNVISGNAASHEILDAANVRQASNLIVAIPEAFEAGQVVEHARSVNAGIYIMARAHSDDEGRHMTGLGANSVIQGEREIARGLLSEFMRHTRRGPPAGA